MQAAPLHCGQSINKSTNYFMSPEVPTVQTPALHKCLHAPAVAQPQRAPPPRQQLHIARSQGAHLAAPAAASRARAACAGSQAAAAGRPAPCRAARSPPALARPRGRPAALSGSLSSAAPGSLGLQPRSDAMKSAGRVCDNAKAHCYDCKHRPSYMEWPRTWHLDAWNGCKQAHRDDVAHSAGLGLHSKRHRCEH